MQITINGEARQVPSPMTVKTLLAELGLEAVKIAIERNLEIVPRSQYAETSVTDGDRIEIVQFIGGG